MLKEIFIKAIKRTWIVAGIFALSELFGGVYLALLISSLADNSFVEDYGITNEYLILGLVLFSFKSFLSFVCLKKLLMTSFNISKEIVITHLNKVMSVKSTEIIDTDKLIKNVSHEVLSLQANGTTPILFIISDSLAMFLMLLIAAYFSPLIVVIFFVFVGIIGLLSYLITRKLADIARLRSTSEQEKIKYTRSLSSSRLIYQNLNIKKLFLSAIGDFADVSAEKGMKHQSITQLPRIYIELLMVVIFSAIIFINLGMNQNYIISSIIILRSIPNLIRIIYNQANIKAASVSAQLLEEGFLSGYSIEDVQTNVSCNLNKNNGLDIYTNNQRYKEQIEIPIGLSVIVGSSGSGKSVLFRNVLRSLNSNNINAQYFSRSMISDDLVIKYLALHFLNGPELDLIPNEIYQIAQRVSLGEKASTGEAERLILVFATLIDADVIVLDEFFLNIEDSQKKLYMDMLKKERKNKITVLISHDRYVQGNQSIQRLEVTN